ASQLPNNLQHVYRPMSYLLNLQNGRHWLFLTNCYGLFHAYNNLSPHPSQLDRPPPVLSVLPPTNGKSPLVPLSTALPAKSMTIYSNMKSLLYQLQDWLSQQLLQRGTGLMKLN
ncbi:unnamed protein product, partial [Aphanomyces euteiches]